MKNQIALMIETIATVKSLAAYLVLTFMGIAITWMDTVNGYIKLVAGLVGLVAGILTCIKVYRDLRK